MHFKEADWAQIEALRAAVMATRAPTIQGRAQELAELFVAKFSAVVLARVFIVQPFAALPEKEQAFARALVKDDARLSSTTPVLCLCGTRGREPAWNDRLASRGHLAIPLLDRAFVAGAPMIAKLLADLEVDLAGLDDGRPIATRRMLGGRNGTFFIPDAQTAFDAQGRAIIPARDFVEKQGVRTVFGMGGAYADGTLAIAILFTDELIDRLVVDRYPSLIANFKMASSALQAAGKVFG